MIQHEIISDTERKNPAIVAIRRETPLANVARRGIIRDKISVVRFRIASQFDYRYSKLAVYKDFITREHR